MRYTINILLQIGFIFSLIASSTASAGTLFSDTNRDKAVSYVFIQTADFAVLKLQDRKKHLYKLILKKAPPYIYYMSDRPQRLTGQIATATFYENWYKQGKDSFQADAPNVSVAGIRLHGVYQEKNTMLMLALSHPHYNSQKNEVTYDATFLSEKDDALLKQTITLDHVVLFLDDWCPGCCC